MRIESTERTRFTWAVAIATAVGLALLFVLAGGSTELSTRAESARGAVVNARALADLAATGGGAPQQFGVVLDQWKRADPSVRWIRLVSLDERSMVASTLPSDRKAGELPRRLVREEKPLFDAAQELMAWVETNREEKVSRKEEVKVERNADGTVTVSAPVYVSGEVSGMVQMQATEEVQTTVVARPRWWIPLLLLAGAVLLMWIVSLAVWNQRLLMAIAAVVIVVGTLFGYGSIAQMKLEGDRQRAEERMRQSFLKVEERAASLRAAVGAAPGRFDVAQWDRDVYGAPRAASKSGGERVYRTVALVSALVAVLALFIGLGGAAATGKALRENRTAYAYVLPALLGMLVLVFFPFLYGIALSFTDQNIYNTSKPLTEIFVGFKNYVDILGDFDVAKRIGENTVFNYKNFYWTLLFTVVWTISNVTIGVTVGLLLALILNTKGLAFRPIYRVLLILPWAVPNYITALIWKGMFHQQFGVINQVIRMFGGEGLAWFEKPLTSFLAVLATNGWLSFPFMMVISLGALQSISADLYEAARVDGASRWQQFRSITLPSLKPALIPAIILSVVWTFNMFNIIFLVSAGEPAGATEILITQAYKIAFEQYRYGYAAAYSTVIFAILLIYGTWQNRVTRATEGI